MPPVLPNKPRWILKEPLAKVMLPPLLTTMGAEFSSWRATEKTLAVGIYFADPYKSSQRGRNENFNGLIRDFYPKGTDFKKLTAQCILDLENLLNNRLRKRLGDLTPLEVFKANCCG